MNRTSKGFTLIELLVVIAIVAVLSVVVILTLNPALHEKEEERLTAVHRLGILDSASDAKYDALTLEATQKLHVPISTVSILDKNREWYKSCQGLEEGVKEGPRDIAFCGWALLAKDIFIVEDTLNDERFKNNPHVIGAPFVRFYAGFAIKDAATGLPIGAFCVKDTKPRKKEVKKPKKTTK
jgi:prepilin-type N-terminal cleavage/methylation domain-containing protein